MTREKKISSCDARRCGDQMHCGTCGLQWDVNDPDPPECQPHPATPRAKGKRALRQLREDLEK